MATLGERLAAGETEAFADLYDACAGRLHRWLCVRLGSRDDADELLQETFVRLARMRRRLRRVESPAAYAFVVARREAARLIAGRRRERARRESHTVATLPDPAADATRRQLDAAEWAAEALKRLNEKEREVVELKVYGGLTLREIADVTGLPAGTVATRYRTAIGRLRDWYARSMR